MEQERVTTASGVSANDEEEVSRVTGVRDDVFLRSTKLLLLLKLLVFHPSYESRREEKGKKGHG